MYPEWKDSRMIYQTATVMGWVVPKTQDLTYIARKWSGAASPLEMLGEPKDRKDREMLDRASQAENARQEIHPVYSIGTSLLFEAAVVLLAMWKFSRQDY